MIVKNLKNSREELQLKQKDVAELFGLHTSTIFGWETGKDPIPLSRLIDYANKYYLSLDYLFGLIAKNEEYYEFNLDLVVLAENLTNLRLSKNLTQEDIAKILNTSQSTYCNYENARNTIKTTFLLGLAKYYRQDDEDFSIDSLFGRIKKNN